MALYPVEGQVARSGGEGILAAIQEIGVHAVTLPT